MKNDEGRRLSSFNEVTLGSTVKLAALEGDQDLVNRLLDMGLHPGSQIEYVNRMIGQGPYVLRFDSTLIALREDEAHCLKVIL